MAGGVHSASWGEARLIDFGSARPLKLPLIAAGGVISGAAVSGWGPHGAAVVSATTAVCDEGGGVHGEYVGPPRGGKWHSAPAEYFSKQGGVTTFYPSTDVYCVASLVLHCVCGQPLFSPPPGAKMTALNTSQHPRRQVRVLESLLQSCFASGPVAAALGRMLQPVPFRRYQCAVAALAALREACAAPAAAVSRGACATSPEPPRLMQKWG